MNSDVATLQSIAKTLEEEPLASQRVLAENAGIVHRAYERCSETLC